MKTSNKLYPVQALIAICGLLTGPGIFGGPSQAAGLDLCGCKGHPQSLGDFDAAKQDTWPPGSALSDRERILTIPLPPDGVLIFDSFLASRWGKRTDYQIRFERNTKNTPVTILVAGDGTIAKHVSVRVDGADGIRGNQHIHGRGGAPGSGGFRGGDGAYLDVNGANDGGEGQGPGGGIPGIGKVGEMTGGSAGTFVGSRDLRPLIGGSGGGGGASTGPGNCSGGGGGGGGGAILFAVNGTLTLDGGINADGGYGSHASNGKCSSGGSFGSGGAIRLIAQTVQGGGGMSARGNRGYQGNQSPGIIRIESLNSDKLRADWSAPPVIRTHVIGPIVNPVASTVAITAIGDQAVPDTLNGINGDVDLVLKEPGSVKVQVQTQGVPAGTTVEVAMKPKAGGAAIRERAELNASGCNAAGVCTAFVAFDLVSGTYFAEARATFETP